MTIYKGKVNCRKFAKKLDEILKLEGYQEISSNKPTDGSVYHSKGTSGKDSIYLKIVDPTNMCLTASVSKKYTPNATQGLAGVFQDELVTNIMQWSTGDNALLDVEYVINITLDRIIAYVHSGNGNAGNNKNITYIGLPKRHDPNDKVPGFVGIATSTYSSIPNVNVFPSLYGRDLKRVNYNLEYYKPSNAIGWGGKLFFSPIYLHSADEGVRGELDSLFITKKIDDYQINKAQNTFEKDGKTYLIIETGTSGTGNLHQSYTYLMEI